MDNLGQLGAKKIQAKIMMRKQLSKYDRALSQFKKRKEVIGCKDRENIIKNQGVKKLVS